MYGPHPRDEAPELTDEEITNGLKRHSLSATLRHYDTKVKKFRIKHGKNPYSNWASSYKNWTTHEMSDHLPVWMELEIDYSDDHLRQFLALQA